MRFVVVYQAAAHCFEELVLMDPRNAHFHCKLAESLFSMNNEHLLNARKHYSISLTHQNASLNLRALYGLIATCQRIQDLSPSTE
jgi:ER membrane protein complex subunit 2